ncbi:MAG: type II toxin-antitoxin system Phd/YefM family antitoxin [Sedimenticolaceae bacterium]
MEYISLTALRQQLFKIVDEVIQTGIPVEIERRGHRLKIVLDDPPRKLANLRPHNAIVGDPDDLVDVETDEWQDDRNL